jgi:hypothetical protein
MGLGESQSHYSSIYSLYVYLGSSSVLSRRRCPQALPSKRTVPRIMVPLRAATYIHTDPCFDSPSWQATSRRHACPRLLLHHVVDPMSACSKRVGAALALALAVTYVRASFARMDGPPVLTPRRRSRSLIFSLVLLSPARQRQSVCRYFPRLVSPRLLQPSVPPSRCNSLTGADFSRRRHTPESRALVRNSFPAHPYRDAGPSALPSRYILYSALVVFLWPTYDMICRPWKAAQGKHKHQPPRSSRAYVHVFFPVLACAVTRGTTTS